MTNRIIKNITTVKVKNLQKVPLYSPWNMKKIGDIECIDERHVDAILKVSDDFFNNTKHQINKTDRLEILKKSKSLLSKRSFEFAKFISLEGGKPLKDSKIEVERAINGIELAIECIKKSYGKEIPMNLNASSKNKMAFTKQFPIGPVLAISAFNHPLNLIIHQVIPAVAAGCPIIIKPSLDTPLTCYEFIKLLINAGLPNGFCQMVNTNNNNITKKFVSDNRISFFSFIGSSEVGWKLKSILSPGTKCALEHGGIAPVIIDKNYNFKKIIPSIIKGSFYHAGQVCVSIQKVIVHEDIIDDFISTMKKHVKKIIIGDPNKINTDVGPLIRKNALIRVDSIVQKAIKNGAKLICGGKFFNNTCYECTILKDPNEKDEINNIEIFGPVICIYSYKTINDAIKKANHKKYAFQSSVYTSDIDTAMLCYEKLEAKSIFINEQTAFRVDWMPFGGIKHSGEGVGGIEYTYFDLLYDKLMVISSDKITK